MARATLHRIAQNWYTTLAAAMDASQLYADVDSATGAPDTPFWCNTGPPSASGEIMRCSNVSAGGGAGGSDRLTVTRGLGGSSASAHAADTVVEQRANALQWQEMQERIEWLEFAMANMRGGPDKSGVIPTAGAGDLKVVAQGTPDMTVAVGAGSALIVGQVGGLLAAVSTAALVAPVTNDRIDTVQLDQAGNVEVKTGAENAAPTAPAVDADALSLAEIYLRPGALSIKDADDATNGYITDSRVYA